MEVFPHTHTSARTNCTIILGEPCLGFAPEFSASMQRPDWICYAVASATAIERVKTEWIIIIEWFFLLLYFLNYILYVNFIGLPLRLCILQQEAAQPSYEWKLISKESNEKKKSERNRMKNHRAQTHLVYSLYDVLLPQFTDEMCGGNGTPWDLKGRKFMNEWIATRSQYVSSSMGASAEVYLEFRLRS